MLKKRILLIGGHGFLGSNILSWIDSNLLPYDVSVLSRRARTRATNFNCIKEELYGNFANREFLAKALSGRHFDYVFHCLSTTVPANSNENIVEDIESNLIATIQLLEIFKHSNSKVVFFSSGGAIYGNSKSIIHKEEDAPHPISSYGILKNCIEQYISIYHNLFGLKYINLRISNPYGPFHSSNSQGIINIAIRKTLMNEPIEIWGDGNNLKDYIFSEDIPAILFQVLEKGIENTTINIGSGHGVSLNSILDIIKKFHSELKVNYKEPRSHDVTQFVLDISALLRHVDFQLTPIESGIRKTYLWQKHEFQNNL